MTHSGKQRLHAFPLTMPVDSPSTSRPTRALLMICGGVVNISTTLPEGSVKQLV